MSKKDKRFSVDKLLGYRLSTLFTAVFSLVGSEINRSTGLIEPVALSSTVSGLAFLLFMWSFVPRWFSPNIREIATVAWVLVLGGFNGINLYNNEGNLIYTVPVLGLAVILLALHNQKIPLLVSVSFLYISNLVLPTLLLESSANNSPFLLIAATFFFVVVTLIRLQSMQMQQDLNESNALLKKRSQELEFQNEELKKFSYVLSHDLKSPIRAIRSLIEFSLEDLAEENIEIPSGINQNFDLIANRAEKLERLIDGVLAYSKAGQKKEKQQVSIRRCLQQTLEQIGTPANFEVIIHGEDAYLHFNPTELYQVFQNLISNAYKYNDKPKGRLEIGIEVEDEYILIAFKYYVKGIENAYLHKVFDLFETLEVRESYESTGIGLAIANRIVGLNEGKISVTSEFGLWTEFSLQFPL